MEKNDNIIHKNTVCNNCDMRPIKGTRYKNLKKVDYSLCEKCFEKRKSIKFAYWHQKYAKYEKPDEITKIINPPTQQKVRNMPLPPGMYHRPPTRVFPKKKE